jgi:hypothetical protein
VVIGDLDGPLNLRAPHELARRAGPRRAARIARTGLPDASVRHAATRVRQALEGAATQLRCAAVVAECPLIMGLLRPR